MTQGKNLQNNRLWLPDTSHLDNENNVDPTTDPSGYQPSEELFQAVQVALTLRMPLLLTGEPGTGKTQAANWVAHDLVLGDPLRFDARSSSVATDLFYRFDSVRYFAEAQAAAVTGSPQPDKRKFIRYEALGTAILRTMSSVQVAPLVSGVESIRLELGSPRTSVVLIDEIDKAPRDFPNDLLAAIEERRFDIPELGMNGNRADKKFDPIIIITSNSEKQLPEAFLRRCVYHHIEIPDGKLPDGKDALREWVNSILSKRLKKLHPEDPEHSEDPEKKGYDDVCNLFCKLRRLNGIEKKPSVSELLDCLQALKHACFNWAEPLQTQPNADLICLTTLLKIEADRRIVKKVRLPVLLSQT
jgi:MoxR-like ATPase